METARGWLESSEDGGVWVLRAGGRWVIADAVDLDGQVRAAGPGPGTRTARIDLAAVDSLDTVGAWLIARTMTRWKAEGVAVEVSGASPAHAALLDKVTLCPPAEDDPTGHHPLIAILERAGHGTFQFIAEAKELLAFFGLTVITFGRSIVQPRRFRLTSLLSHVERVGLDAMPIVMLLSLLIGLVLSQQGAFQLQRFGAVDFTVNLVGISMLREIGIVLTAVIIAGRSGSAFTAQIGTMKVNEEVDAMLTLGLDPMELLVLPRLIALMIALPLLCFVADMMGLLGGALYSVFALDMSLEQFLSRLRDVIGPWTFWVGIIKAPVFAFLIAMTGCYHGLKVSGSAESVGLMTTKSVVVSIFMVIVADALFAILFSSFGI